MFAKTFIIGIVSLGALIASTTQVSAGDGLPIFSYKGTVKRYDDVNLKTVSYTYNAYMVIDDVSGTATIVWFGGTGSAKWYWVDDSMPVEVALLDAKGNAYFVYGDSDFGFGKMTFKSGAYSSVSISGNIADTVYGEAGTFSFRYNSTLTKKGITTGADALDVAIADLVAKKYVAVE